MIVSYSIVNNMVRAKAGEIPAKQVIASAEFIDEYFIPNCYTI